ncbi:hypothetical protein AcW1_005724 [Taiwanofungus camphoratus]|nr:hypothetical protein AcW1_005724 [Antrodia cinnamomea]
MSKFDTEVSSLKKVISRYKGKGKKSYSETVEQVSSHLILINSSVISSQASQKLVRCLRQPLVSLYATFPLVSLQFSASIFYKIYHEKVLTAFGKHLVEQKILWELVLNSLLSGVLDYLDENNTDKNKQTVADVLYPALCDICFSLTAPMMSVDLRYTAYTLLSDSAVAHIANQQKLRQENILGGERLGALIWRTKDFLVLEALLNLFARILPSTKNSVSGRAKRTAFIQSVFMSSPPPESASAGHQVADLLEHIAVSEWEEMASKIIAIMAESNISFPQPFVVNEVIACGQRKPSDRLYIDSKAIVVNILIGNDQCESLDVLYTTIRRIEIMPQHSREDNSVSEIILHLTIPPVLGKETVVEEPCSSKYESPRVIFGIKKDNMSHFIGSLQNRGLKYYLKEVALAKLSIAQLPTTLNFDSKGNPIKELSQDERIENLTQFYHTNQSSDDPPQAPVLENAEPGTPMQSAVVTSGNDPQKDHTSSRSNNAIVQMRPTGSDRSSAYTRPVSIGGPRPLGTTFLPKNRTSQNLRDAVFGTSDEELSEISDPEFPPLTSAELKPSFDTKMKVSNMAKVSHARAPATKTVAVRRIYDSDDDIPSPRRTPLANGDRVKDTKAKKMVRNVSNSSDYELGNDVGNPISGHKDTSLAPVTPTKESREKAGDTYVYANEKTTSRVCSPLNVTNKEVCSIPASVVEDEPAVPIKALTEKSVSLPKAIDTQNTGTRFTLSSDPHKNICDHDTASSGLVAGLQSVSAPLKPSSVREREMIAASIRHPKRMDDTYTADGKHQTNTKDVHYSSSPVTAVKNKHKSVKANLRKKDCTAPDDLKKASHVSASKRKRLLVKQSKEDLDILADPDIEYRHSKRPRRTTANHNPEPAIPSERTESQVLRPRATAATRATKKYRGKKEQPSSLADIVSKKIDYDELPTSSPRTGTRNGLLPSHEARTRVRRFIEASTTPTAPEIGGTALMIKAEPQIKVDTKDSPKLLAITVAERNDGDAYSKQASDLFNTANVSDVKSTQSMKAVATEPSQNGSKKPPREYSSKPSSLKKPHCAPLTNIHIPQLLQRKSINHIQAFEEDMAESPTEVIPVRKRHPQDADKLSLLNEPRVHHGPISDDDDLTRVEDVITETITTVHDTLDEGLLKKHRLPQTPLLETNAAVVSKAAVSANNTVIETIDLTQDDSPIKSKASLILTSPSSPVRDITCNTVNSMSPLSSSTPLRKSAIRGDRLSSHLSAVPSSRHSVTFAPTVNERELSPLVSYLNVSIPNAEGEFLTKDTTLYGSSSIFKGSGNQRHEIKSKIGQRAKRSPASKPPVMQDIVDVLEQIHQAIFLKISSKFEGVRDDIRTGRDALLAEATADLSQMRAESVTQFNQLIDLEAEYAKSGRAVANGLEDALKVNQYLCGELTKIIEGHDRHTMSKKMPACIAPPVPPMYSSRDGR